MSIATRPWAEVVIFGVVLTVLAELLTRLWKDFFPDQQFDDYALVWFGIGVSVAVLCVAIIRELRAARKSN